jgi:periplasmic copper chaperone A
VNRRSIVVLLTAISLTACAEESGPPVSVHDVRILAPLSGDGAAIAYLVVENQSDMLITLKGFSSPQFSRVEMHETSIMDGISRMRRLAFVKIESHASAAFETGGKHVMLMGASIDVSPGSPVTLQVHYDQGLLIVSAVMRDRLTAE